MDSYRVWIFAPCYYRRIIFINVSESPEKDAESKYFAKGLTSHVSK